jgi:ribosomal protein S18 acetylase RimI-like enzyme
MSLHVFRQSTKVMGITLNMDKTLVGQVRFTQPCSKIHPGVAYINTIDVAKEYQNMKIGSSLLHEMNKYLIVNTKAKCVKGVLWDDNTQPFLSNFFLKNGYIISDPEHIHYDDGENLFDIIPIERELNRQNITTL